MKKWWLLLLAGLLTALVSFAVTYRIQQARKPDQFTWMKQEFALTDAQVAEIEKLHRAYEPICAEHCRKIADARGRLSTLHTKPNESSSELAEAQRVWENLRRECDEATRGHLQSVAAVMSPPEGKRFLDLVGPKLTSNPHTGAVPLR
jgi:septal ring factor EnvC (AmiA/AmiB activator)